MAAKWFTDNGQDMNHKGSMLAYLFVAIFVNLFGFSQQSSQCQERFLQEPYGKYKFVVDCSNLGLEDLPGDLSDLVTILQLNGNRLKKINSGAFDKLTLLQNLDLSGNDLTSLPQGIFEKTPKLKTIDLRRNRLHCDWRVWWLVNFTKTLDEFNGYCFSPASLRGRDVRKLTEKDVIVDCESKRKLHKNSKDGHYKFNVAGTSGKNIELLIYCHNMQSDAPKEYLSLPSGKQSNFISSAATRTEGCIKSNASFTEATQFVGFNKVRILLRTLSILPDDITFSSSTKSIKYGQGRVCGINNSTACVGADAKIDLRGTPFKIKNNVNWQTLQYKKPVNVVRKSGGAVVEIKCSSICGGCVPTGLLLLEPMNSQLMPYEACTRPLGIQDGGILAANITASSFLDRNFLPSYARLHGNGYGGWCAAKQNKAQFIQVDLGLMHTVSGISTQGYKTYNDWVTSYKLHYKTEDDEIWKEYTLFGNPKIFQGNVDSNSVVTHWLSPRFRARSVRIQPNSWYNGDFLEHRVCLRFELYGCKNDVSSHAIKLGSTKPCLVPLKNVRNISDEEEPLTFNDKCSGKDFMFQLKDESKMMHTLSGYCLGMSSNFTAILTKNCRQSRFTYQRIDRSGSKSSNFIIKDRITKKCIRLKRARNKRDVHVILKRCSDLSQILLILSKTGVVALKPHFKEPREARKVDMWSSQLFSCKFVSDPPSLFAWSKEVPLMNGGKRLLGDNFEVFSNGSLLVRNVTWNNRGNYFCNVLNSEGSQTRLIELDVHAIQRFVKLPASQTTIVSRTVKFDCKVEGIPPPRILWKFKPQATQEFTRIDSLDQRRFKLSPDGSLSISNVHTGDKGVYVCIAKSPGTKKNATATLVVYVPPRITLSSKKKNLFVGDSTRVTCLATGDPYPKISWFSLLDLNSTNPRQRGQADGNMSLERVTKKDEGVYVCEAENIIGKATATFQLVVTATCRLIYIRYSNIKPKKSFHIENQKVGISCQKGFRLVGASTLHCTKHGNWSRPFPRCVDIDECSSSTAELTESSGYMMNQDTEPDVCHVNAFCVNTIGSYKCSCEEGYVGNGFTCNWRSTTTKAPTTITEPRTTRPIQTETVSIATKLVSETDTTPVLLTTASKEATFPTLKIVVRNYTEGRISELALLEHLLTHSRSIERLPSMQSKMQSLNVSLSALGSLLAVTKKESNYEKSLKNFVVFTDVVSNLLDDATKDVWRNLQQTSAGTSQLLSVVDQYSRRQLENLDGLSNKNDAQIISKNLVVKIHDLKMTSNSNGVELSVASHDKSGSKPRVILQNDIIEPGKKSTAILVWFKTLSSLLSKRSVNSSEGTFSVSDVISLTVSSIKDGTKLKKPIRLEFEIAKAVSKSPECAFWKFNTSFRGSWSLDGCRLVKYSSQQKQDKKSKVICECDHLTNFAVIERRPLDGQRKSPTFFILTLSLSVIIGCGLSIFFAFITCISHLCFSSHVRSDRRIIMINICASILLGSTVFLSGALLSSFKLIKQDSAKYFCLVMSGSLQLFFVAFFSWMLAEAIQIFLSTKTVIDKSSGKLTMFYLLGWGTPVVVVGSSLLLIIFKKVQITSWCWIDLSSYTHFLLTGVPAVTLFIITVIFYALICASLKKNNDLLNPFLQRYTRVALWLSPVLLILHVMTIIALAAYLTFNKSLICHYILGALYAVEGVFLIIYQCYVEKMVLAKSGSMSPKSKKRQHSYSVKDTVTYGDETCIEDGNGKYLIRRPSKRSLQESGRNSVSLSVGLGVSRKSDLDIDSDSNYFDMYGTSQKFVSGKPSKRVPVVVNEDDEDEQGQLLRDNEGSDRSSEAYSDMRETQLTSFETNNFNKKPSSTCGSVLSIETKPRPMLQGIPVYFPGSAPPQHQLTLERPKDKVKADVNAEAEKYDNVDFDGCSSHNTRDSMDPETISNISSELSSILKELEAFSAETSPCLNRRAEATGSATGSATGAATGDFKKSPSVWQRRRPPYERQNHVEMKDVHFRTVPSSKANWYGTDLKDSGDGLHKCTDDLYTSF